MMNRYLVLLFTLFVLGLSSCNQKSQQKSPQIEAAPQIVDRIMLANGGVIQGKLVEETSQIIRIEWQDGIVGFHPSEIQSIERGVPKDQVGSVKDDLSVPTFESEEEKKAKWPEGVDHRVLMKNGEWVHGRIISKSADVFTVRQQLEGGGSIELDLKLDRIEKIELWRPPIPDGGERLSEFRKKYRSLELIQKGNYTVLTSESDPADLKAYLKTLDQFYHDFLFYFFELIDLNRSPEPLDVIIFGTRNEFDRILSEIGYNARSNPVGFYHFHAKKLFFYNVKADHKVQAALHKSYAFQSQMATLKSEVEARYGPNAGSVRGQIERATEAAEREELRILGEASLQNVRVLRHESAHQLFHLLGITPIEVYSGGWLIEGLAVYCEPEPIGDINGEKLMQLRFELEKNELMPLEYLLNFGRGTGFHKLDPRYAQLAYAESWAFIYFLMQKYREAFLGYLVEMRTQNQGFNSDAERKLLEKHLTKDLKAIEQEFFPFVRKLIAESIDEKTYQDSRLRFVTAS